jgi:hypothetical protein
MVDLITAIRLHAFFLEDLVAGRQVEQRTRSNADNEFVLYFHP